MQYTTNYNLKKPGYTDPADIEDINANMDVLDAELQARESDTNTHVANTSNPHGVNKSQVGLGNVDNVKQAPYTHLSATGAHIAENISLNSANFSANQVKDALDELFTSVSNGKNLIATSITDKGVPTSGSDSFNTMANNIDSIETSGVASVQTGFVVAYGSSISQSTGENGVYADITISAVDVPKSVCLVEGGAGYNSTEALALRYGYEGYISAEIGARFIDSTTLRLFSPTENGSIDTIVGEWRVVEYV